MDNAGQNNASISIFYLMLFFLPTVLYMIKCCLEFTQQITYIPNEETQTPMNTIVINNNHKTHNQQPKRKITQKTKEKILRNEFGIVKIAQTSDNIKENAAQALVKLGFKSSDAKKIIKKMCINNVYSDESSLIQDCFKEN